MAKQTKKRTGTKFLIFLLVIACILGVGYYYSHFSKSLENWIKQEDTPIVEHMNKGADLFEAQQYTLAEKEFQTAFKLAKIADTASSQLWKERMEKIAPPRKFYTGDPANRYASGSMYFKEPHGRSNLRLRVLCLLADYR